MSKFQKCLFLCFEFSIPNFRIYTFPTSSNYFLSGFSAKFSFLFFSEGIIYSVYPQKTAGFISEVLMVEEETEITQ